MHINFGPKNKFHLFVQAILRNSIISAKVLKFKSFLIFVNIERTNSYELIEKNYQWAKERSWESQTHKFIEILFNNPEPMLNWTKIKL